MPETWCFRCRKKTEMIDPVPEVTETNRIMYRGICVECDSKVALMSGYAKSSIRSSTQE